MARQRQEILIDDLDGGPADETIRFAVDGGDYEIDLSATNADRFRRQLAPYLSRARAVLRPHRRPRRASAVWTDPHKVRAWAKWAGYTVNTGGYPRRELVKAYLREWVDDKVPEEFM